MTERILSQEQAAEMWFCEEFTVWHFATKCTGVKLVKSECRGTSPNREIQNRLVRPCVHNVPGKIGEASPAGYTHGKAAQRLPKDQMEWPRLI